MTKTSADDEDPAYLIHASNTVSTGANQCIPTHAQVGDSSGTSALANSMAAKMLYPTYAHVGDLVESTGSIVEYPILTHVTLPDSTSTGANMAYLTTYVLYPESTHVTSALPLLTMTRQGVHTPA